MNYILKVTFIILLLGYIMNQNAMAQNTYSISVDIKATPSEVWQAITDFQSYDSWNTVLSMQNNDDLTVGEKFKVTITEPNGKTSKFKAKTLAKTEPDGFTAKQTMIGNWFFSATHHFTVEKKSADITTFSQTWEFTGILFKPFKKAIFKQLDLFNQMNSELKSYLENR